MASTVARTSPWSTASSCTSLAVRIVAPIVTEKIAKIDADQHHRDHELDEREAVCFGRAGQPWHATAHETVIVFVTVLLVTLWAGQLRAAAVVGPQAVSV